MRWPDRVADGLTDWMATPAALIQGVCLVAVWWLPFLVFGWSWQAAALGLMDVLTIGSWVTQFPIAYASRRAEQHSALLLRNLNDTMRLLVAIAEKQEDQLEEIHDAADKAAAGAMARAATVTARAAAAASAAYASALELGVESDLPQEEALAREET